MSKSVEPLRQLFRDAISGDYVISAERINQLRAKSEKEISNLKMVFWIAIGLLNLMIWDPFTLSIPTSMRIIGGVGSLVIALLFPLVGIRRHKQYLYQLEDSFLGPKRRNTDDAGRRYMDKVKQQGRVFVRVEYELLQGEELPPEK